jgi:Sugar (and other) transporter
LDRNDTPLTSRKTMAQPAATRNILTTLDERPPTSWIGLAIGADSAIATAYIAEYAPKNRRGSLALLQQWMITVGILVACLVALIIFSAFPASAASTGWRLVLGLGAVPALIGLVLRTQVPESPRWLLRHGRCDQLRRAMATLGTGDVTDEEITAPRQLSSGPARAVPARPGHPACAGLPEHHPLGRRPGLLRCPRAGRDRLHLLVPAGDQGPAHGGHRSASNVTRRPRHRSRAARQ